MALALLVGNAVICLLGPVWLGTLLGWEKPMLHWGALSFLVRDALKLGLAQRVIPLSGRMVRARSGSSRFTGRAGMGGLVHASPFHVAGITRCAA
ncbi:biotin transporter BioY [Mameliella sp. AT18]|uniref:biotin transporter BioY n=1 Tax=Mameliella sp. AT18 TaxID=3028385 RepID=UPI00237BCA97|nr:biotin transporter BioY [Mameliella sp. AT18]MDD9731687.1 biotin transporter BioY [Mameliella sp. AT18]